jgi:Zn ribbon nucleic-acid-binding protein
MKVTEKQLKARTTELNIGKLKNTTFGIKVERTPKGYAVELAYRDSTPSEILLPDASASEAHACIEGVAASTAAISAAGSSKPEFITRETFIRQSGERCPKCQTRDIHDGRVKTANGILEQLHSCSRCGIEWNSLFRLDDYVVINKPGLADNA